MSYSIVNASEADLPGILAIYNDAVEFTTAIWNETLVDLANRRAWLAERTAAGFPVLVARDAAGDVIGYASYGTWRSIEGFRHTVEHSVYVRADQRGQKHRLTQDLRKVVGIVVAIEDGRNAGRSHANRTPADRAASNLECGGKVAGIVNGKGHGRRLNGGLSSRPMWQRGG